MLSASLSWLLAAQVVSLTPPPGATPTPATSKGPIVVMRTSIGRIVIALDRDKAPLSVANFIKYVRSGSYDRTIFHRVIPRFMIQGGGYDEQLKEQPTQPPVRNESANGLSNRRGTIAMARTSDPNSATAQFYINLANNAQLDGAPGRPGYTVFGQVLEGMEVVDRIAATPTRARDRMFANLPTQAIVILSVREAPDWKPAGAEGAKPPLSPSAVPASATSPAASPAP
jgi:peptidyl-prolyl cis-trans isomerase A (cyclophilin A)